MGETGGGERLNKIIMMVAAGAGTEMVDDITLIRCDGHQCQYTVHKCTWVHVYGEHVKTKT